MLTTLSIISDRQSVSYAPSEAVRWLLFAPSPGRQRRRKAPQQR